MGLVGHYPANNLMGRAPVLRHPKAFFVAERMRYCWLFPAGIPHRRVGTHVFLSRSPLPPRRVNVRLACIRHAASVDPEPGSNSSSCVSRAAPCRNSGHARSIPLCTLAWPDGCLVIHATLVSWLGTAPTGDKKPRVSPPLDCITSSSVAVYLRRR